MKYSLIFAATAAAYEAYQPAPSSSSAIGYTTVVPGYGKEPVTVTTQHQPYPTCVSAGYGDKTCDKWTEDMYVSTVIKDADKKDCTVTNTKQPVTVYHTKKTITHSATGVYNGYASPTGGYAHPTGYPGKNETGCWYELYEKIETAEYKDLGPHALPGYPGSGLCKDSEKKQKVHVKEYKGGKWSEYEQVHSYGVPEAESTPTYGQVHQPEVTSSYEAPAEQYGAPKGEKEKCAVPVTVTVTAKETVYVTKGYPTGKYPTQPTGAHDEYGYTKPSATPEKPTEDEPSYPQYPVPGNGTHGHDSYPTATPVYIYSKPSYGGEDYPNGPHKASSTPCSEDKLKPTPSASKPADEYPAYPEKTPEVSSKAPEYPAYPVETPEVSSKAPEYPAYPAQPTAAKPSEYQPGNGYGAQPEPTKAYGSY